jgi:hypothetical protein
MKLRRDKLFFMRVRLLMFFGAMANCESAIQ